MLDLASNSPPAASELVCHNWSDARLDLSRLRALYTARYSQKTRRAEEWVARVEYCSLNES